MTTAGDSSDERPKTWHADAQATAKDVLRAHARDLYREAERVSSRADADCVSTKHVKAAAQSVRLGHVGNALYDTLYTVGTTVVGGGAGGLFTALAVPADSKVPGWIETLSWILLFAGGVLSAIGLTGKYVRR